MNDNKNLKSELIKNDFQSETKVGNKYIFSKFIEYFDPERERTDRERLIVSLFSNFFFALSNLILKFISKYYPNASGNTTTLYRFIIMSLISYLYLYLRKLEFIPITNVKSKFTLGIRILSAYITVLALTNSVFYLRLGTSIAFMFISPIFTSVASIYIFNDKFKQQNVVGLILCIVAMLMITSSESSGNDNPNFDIRFGLFWGTLSTIGTIAMVITTKMLVKDIDSINLNYFIGLYSSYIGILLCSVTGNLIYFQIGYILLACLNGLTFWCALYFMNISLKINNLIAVSCIGFLSLVYAFGFGLIFFNEGLKFIDVIASFIIFSFNIYSIIFPVPQINNK